jgi:hypothetical protein
MRTSKRRKITMAVQTPACSASQPERTAFERLRSHLRKWRTACADAYAAASMYEEQRTLSNAELRRRGLSRTTLAREIWRRLERKRRSDEA